MSNGIKVRKRTSKEDLLRIQHRTEASSAVVFWAASLNAFIADGEDTHDRMMEQLCGLEAETARLRNLLEVEQDAFVLDNLSHSEEGK